MLLTHAESMYNAANTTTPYTMFSDSIPAVAGAYNSSDYRDDLCLAALALAIATNQSKYYADAYNYYETYSLTGSQEVWNWDSKTPAAYVLFVEAAIARPGLAEGAGLSGNLSGWQKETEQYFDGLINGKFKNAYLTKGKPSVCQSLPGALTQSRRIAILGRRFRRGVAESGHGGSSPYVQVCAYGFQPGQDDFL